jgi:hypothetical protein
MNNVVEGMNLAAKHSEMSAKPKDNMNTDANSMQSYSNLKSKSHTMGPFLNLGL